MFQKKHWVYQPAIAEVMADLGDNSKVVEVVELYRQGRYDFDVRLPGDMTAGLQARIVGERLEKRFSEKK